MILHVVRKYGLKWSLSRKITLFSVSCIGHGYINILPKYLGFSYRAIGSIIENKEIQSLVNDAYIGQQIEQYLSTNSDALPRLFVLSENKYAVFEKQVSEIEEQSARDPLEAVRRITQLYPEYCALLGVYNCFWRYLGNRDRTEKLSPEMVKEVGAMRDKIASLYPRIEKVFILSSSVVAEENNLEKDLLHYLTVGEMDEFLKTGELKKILVEEVKKRKLRAFYFLEEGKQPIVVTNEKIIAEIAEEVLPKATQDAVLKGYSAFGGEVQGKVFNARETHKSKIEHGVILVTSMTSPGDISLVKKSKAIVTDEGGALCHAAVIARELKIPCVVGTKTATAVFHTGDEIKVDAVKGIVRKVM